jgi:hypothetical protein
LDRVQVGRRDHRQHRTNGPSLRMVKGSNGLVGYLKLLFWAHVPGMCKTPFRLTCRFGVRPGVFGTGPAMADPKSQKTA